MSIAYIDGTVTVDPAPETVTASSGGMVYGGTPFVVTPGYSGPVPATNEASCLPILTMATAAGTYPSTCFDAADPNHAFSYVAGSVTVDPAPETVTASSGGMVYGGTPFVVTPGYSGPVPATRQASCVPILTVATAAGTYPSTCSGAADPNHAFSYVAGSVTVTAAPVTVTASSTSMKAGSGPPTITPSYSGLLNGASATATPPTCSTDATPSSPVGSTWPTNCSGASDSNYAITYVDGIVTVIAGNRPPVCTSGSGSTSINAPGTGSLACTDPDFNALHYKLVAPAGHGTVVVSDAGVWTYTPVTDYLGQDSFTFKANDSLLDSNVATLTLLVEPDPTAHNDVASVRQGNGPTVIAVLANDVDNDPGDHLVIESITQGANGTVAISPDGSSLTYDPIDAFLGTDSFSYTVIDVTKRTSTAFVQIAVVPIRPVTSTPLVTIVAPAGLGSSTVPVRITWKLADPGTGLKRYQLQELRGGGTWTNIALLSPTALSALRTITLGTTFRYRVRAIDTANHVGAWATGLVTTPALNQETATTIAYAGTWRTGIATGLSGGRSRFSGSIGASATFTFTGFSVGWVSQLGSRQGTASVYIDGTLVRVVNLRATTSSTRRLVFSKVWSKRGAHTLRIVVLGAAGGARIDADAFAVLK